MNNVILLGRLVRDPEVRYSQGEEQKCTARYTLAVDRRGKDAGADFVSCVSFGRTAEFMERFGKKGVKFCVEGRIHTGSYERDGQKVYTTDVVVESLEFAESKNSSDQNPAPAPATNNDGFMNIPDDIAEDLPFN